MVELKKLDILSTALMSGFLNLLIGLIFGLIFGCFALIGMAGLNSATDGLFDFTGIGALVFICAMPIIYGIIGFIGGAILALAYNIVANVIGGIKFELDMGSANLAK
jgi:hypothetical protein